MDIEREPEPCRECGSAVPPDATVCPACEYTVARHDRWRVIWGIPGMALTLSIIFAPLGIPMLWQAVRHRRAANGTVTSPSAEPVISRNFAGDWWSRSTR